MVLYQRIEETGTDGTARVRCVEAVHRYIVIDAQLDWHNLQGNNSPVHIACRNGDLMAMKELLSNVQTPEEKFATFQPEV